MKSDASLLHTAGEVRWGRGQSEGVFNIRRTRTADTQRVKMELNEKRPENGEDNDAFELEVRPSPLTPGSLCKPRSLAYVPLFAHDRERVWGRLQHLHFVCFRRKITCTLIQTPLMNMMENSKTKRMISNTRGLLTFIMHYHHCCYYSLITLISAHLYNGRFTPLFFIAAVSSFRKRRSFTTSWRGTDAGSNWPSISS